MTKDNNLISHQNSLAKFGFKDEGTGVHTSRTMMYEELHLLLETFNNSSAQIEEYIEAIIEGNCLGKRSVRNRKITATRLKELYGLDNSLIVFRVLHFFWSRDELGRPLIALLCALTRDQLLYKTVPFILNYKEGAIITRADLEGFINDIMPDNYSSSTLKSVAQNINSTWTKSGHLRGRRNKIRAKATATPGAAAYALLLGYLTGARGEYLFNTEYARVLDCSYSELLDLAEEASRRGWIVLKHIGDVIEVQFPSLLTKEELEWVHEQN